MEPPKRGRAFVERDIMSSLEGVVLDHETRKNGPSVQQTRGEVLLNFRRNGDRGTTRSDPLFDAKQGIRSVHDSEKKKTETVTLRLESSKKNAKRLCLGKLCQGKRKQLSDVGNCECEQTTRVLIPRDPTLHNLQPGPYPSTPDGRKDGAVLFYVTRGVSDKKGRERKKKKRGRRTSVKERPIKSKEKHSEAPAGGVGKRLQSSGRGVMRGGCQWSYKRGGGVGGEGGIPRLTAKGGEFPKSFDSLKHPTV